MQADFHHGLLDSHRRPKLRHEPIPPIFRVRNLAGCAPDSLGLLGDRQPVALFDVDDVLHVNEPFRRVLVEVRDNSTAALHRGIHARVVRAHALLEEGGEKRAVHEVIEHRSV